MNVSLEQKMSLIRNNRITQFMTPLTILASQLVPGVFTPIQLPQLVDTLWMPASFAAGGVVAYNPVDLVIGVKLNLESAPILPFGLNSNLVAKVNGPVERLFVTLLSGDAAQTTLFGGRGISVAYNGMVVGAGTPDNTTTNPPA